MTLPAPGLDGERRDVLLVTEPGGHLLEMWVMRDVAGPGRRIWCTVDGADTRSLLRDEHVIFGHGPTTRSVTNLLRNLWTALTVLHRHHPRVVLCTGSGITVPFAWLGRAFGAYVIFVECGGRVDAPSLSCRLVAPVAHRTYVQWPELRNKVRRGRYRGRLPWESASPRSARRARRRVLVTTGTSRLFPFDRLVASSRGFADAVVTVQRGCSSLEPPVARVVDFLKFDDLRDEIRAADLVVTHAGIGSVLLALANGHRPIVMARRRALGESVDDHQVAFACRLRAAGVAVVVEDPAELVSALRDAESPRASSADDSAGARLLIELRNDVRAVLGGPLPTDQGEEQHQAQAERTRCATS